MTPENFAQANGTLTGGPANDYGTTDDVEDLPVWRGQGEVVSCWRMTWGERLKVLLSGRVWLHVAAEKRHAPVLLQAWSPWE